MIIVLQIRDPLIQESLISKVGYATSLSDRSTRLTTDHPRILKPFGSSTILGYQVETPYSVYRGSRFVFDRKP